MRMVVREMRGIPSFLLKEYLQEMGGSLVEDNFIRGEGWSVRLEKMEPFRLGSLSVGQTRLTIHIEDHLVEGFLAQLGKKTLRAGA